MEGFPKRLGEAAITEELSLFKQMDSVQQTLGVSEANCHPEIPADAAWDEPSPL